MTFPITFGVFMPQGWKMELAGIEGAEAKWQQGRRHRGARPRSSVSTRCGSTTTSTTCRVPAHEAVFECWTTMAAISQRTTRIRLGQMVGCNSYRQPSVLAKITSTVDVISGGRLDWGIGAGWYENEYKGYGFEFPAPKVRIGMLKECVEIVRSMWTEQETTYDGKYYKLEPRQLRPEAIAAAAPAASSSAAAESSSRCASSPVSRIGANFGGKPEEFARKCEILKDHCKAVGRDYDEIEKTISGEVMIRESEDELRAIGTKSLWGEEFDSWQAGKLDRHARPGGREDPDVHRPGRHGLLPLDERLPVDRDDRTIRWRGEAVPLAKSVLLEPEAHVVARLRVQEQREQRDVEQQRHEVEAEDAGNEQSAKRRRRVGARRPRVRGCTQSSSRSISDSRRAIDRRPP